ncbi:MAG: amidohydrolase [Candidatus Nanopelagicales bacterium]
MNQDQLTLLDALVVPYDLELRAMRRDIHTYPELARDEHRTTRVVADRLSQAGLTPHRLPGTGLTCDIGDGRPRIALRADMDALSVRDEKDVPYRSQVDGVAHCCGHDMHTVIALGAGLVLNDLHRAASLTGAVRLVFQPAEEATPGGALDVLASGALEGVDRILGLHCDPRHDVGEVGVRVGSITGSADEIRVRISGPGGHTARPHLTADVVYALAKVVADVPAVLSRRVDPRASLSVVWGQIFAGRASNAIPEVGEAAGTVRALDVRAWQEAPKIIEDAIRGVAAPYDVRVDVTYTRGVAPVVNEPISAGLLEAAALATGADVHEAEQSLGGEDFGWYLQQMDGAMGRLGVRTPGGPTHDLHQGHFDADEDAIAVGVKVLAGAALLALT